MKSARIIIAISEKEKKAMTEKARENSMSVAEFIRDLFRRYQTREELKNAD